MSRIDEAVTNIRPASRVLRGQAASDGAGVRLTRIIGGPELPQMDPFLLLDEFRSDSPGDYIGGFPDHPHRGFETVTYMLAGRMRHADNQGNAGLLEPGSVQWMTAGRGLIHSEMPEQENGLLWGFQLWVNLPASDKMTAPRYQDIGPAAIPQILLPGGAQVRIIAGSIAGKTGPVSGIATQPIYLDLHLPANSTTVLPVASELNAFAYLYEGSACIGEHDAARLVERGELALLGTGGTFRVQTRESPARLILVAGRALHEPIARYGPFVMNTRTEILTAVEDFNAGRF